MKESSSQPYIELEKHIQGTSKWCNAFAAEPRSSWLWFRAQILLLKTPTGCVYVHGQNLKRIEEKGLWCDHFPWGVSSCFLLLCFFQEVQEPYSKNLTKYTHTHTHTHTHTQTYTHIHICVHLCFLSCRVWDSKHTVSHVGSTTLTHGPIHWIVWKIMMHFCIDIEKYIMRDQQMV